MPNTDYGPLHTEAGFHSQPARLSLSEVHRSLVVPASASFFRKLFAFAGPGFLIAVGYMDPGNWATDLAGGSKYNFALLSVVMISNLMAILLQALSLKLGIVTGRDLAQACRDHYSRPVSFLLWFICELAIAACDLAEIIGSAIALNLLFGIPLLAGVCITALDVLIVLFLQNKGFRYIEALVIALIFVIGGCFAWELIVSRPDLLGIAKGFVPSAKIITDPGMLYIAIGILGATVMPHNLYLHSSIVQTRRYKLNAAGKREAIKFATIDSTLALMFALALLASGQNSTLTGTLAGQIVMEGFLNIRIRPWLRRLLTRGIAIIPAIIVTVISGEKGTTNLLVLSQVVLSLQLSFAVFPLVMFTSNKLKMGEFVNGLTVKCLAWLIAVVIAALNAWLLVQIFQSWFLT